VKTVTVSSKFQIVIPKGVRESLDIKPGQRLFVLEHRGCVELIPERPIARMRGFLKGLDASFEREEEDRF